MAASLASVAVAMLAISGAVDKGPYFQPYKAPLPAFSVGDGGEHTAALGIEVWSQGAPQRPFQILGTLTEDRAIGDYAGPSRKGFLKIIARDAKSAGGDAVILDQAVWDVYGRGTELATRNMRQYLSETGHPNGGFVAARSRFWVVKYLSGPPAATGSAPP
jgi:hypothetical protein